MGLTCELRFAFRPSTFLKRVSDDFVQAARSTIAEEFGVLMSLDETMLDLMYMYSKALNKREADRKKAAQSQE